MKKNNNCTTPQEVAREFGIVYLDLRNDYAFKRVFGTAGNEDLLLMLVRAFLPDENIVSVSLINREQMGERARSRKAVFDISCTTDNGSIVNVEMQLGEQSDFGERMIFYSGFPVRDSIHRKTGLQYEFPHIYIIGILDFILNKDQECREVITRFNVQNEHGVLLTKRMQYITVELPKFNKELKDLESDTDRLLYLLKYMGGFIEQPKEFSNEKFDKLFKLTKFAAMEYNDQMEYVRQFMAELDEESRLKTATRNGEEKGREDVARKMKAKGLQTQLIADCTGLTAEQIAAL